MLQYVYIPCQNGHFFIWAGDPNQSIPEGLPCECGQTISHYEKCAMCDQWHLIAQPAQGYQA
jgi:hypothetical protein